MSELEKRALSYGIQPEYEGIGSTTHKAPKETLEKLLKAFGAKDAEMGPIDADQQLEAPEGVSCYLPDGGRLWGVALQLYQIRSQRNWGIGDFADLEVIAEEMGAAGADFIGLNPLHALFLSNPAHCSPFSPSNRQFLNPLYIAVDRVPGFDAATLDEDMLAAAREGDLVDYTLVTALKVSALRRLWETGGFNVPDDFLRAGGEDLERHALFEAVSAHMVAEGHGAGWLAWPAEWQDANGAKVAAFAEEHADEQQFHLWLQYVAHEQLSAARAACKAAGMGIGLYLDFAVGEAADGSGSWGRPQVVSGVRVGAPPDYFNEYGQDWGLAPLSPVAMAADRAAPFRSLMQQSTQQAGALRIDHAMGLWQLFLMPEGTSPAEGTYARYPIKDMLRGLAEASNENRTIIIGEDLGNVPPGFREVMEKVGILSYRILFFERDEDGFIPPADYPEKALVCLSTHDLPTFQGWWRGDDVALRAQFDLISTDAADEQSASRKTEREDLLRDLVRDGLLEASEAKAATPDIAPEALVVAVHQHLARTPSRLCAVRLEDLAGEREPVNLPSTVDEYPNWRRKLGVSLEELPAAPLFRQITAALRAERPKGSE